jgi:PTS system mannose-specific IIA component
MDGCLCGIELAGSFICCQEVIVIGILIITHASLGKELIGAAEFILGGLEKVEAMAVEAGNDPDALQQRLKKSIARLSNGDGVLILTDMFGGTPNNISLSYLEPGKVEVVTGVNLPMLIKAVSERSKCGLEKLASKVGEAGREAISSAGELLAS